MKKIFVVSIQDQKSHETLSINDSIEGARKVAKDRQETVPGDWYKSNHSESWFLDQMLVDGYIRHWSISISEHELKD